MKALEKSDMRRIAFFSTVESETSHMLMTATPGRDFAFVPFEWHELMQWYWGLPSIMLADHVGSRINNDSTRLCDPYGLNLLGGSILPGDAWRKRHDHVKWALVEALNSMDVDVECEVLGLFSQFVSQEGRDHLMSSHRARQGLIPDFKMTVGNRSHLMDLKGISLCHTWYVLKQRQTDPKPLWAVEARAKEIPRYYLRRAHANIDVEFNGTNPDEVGPMEKALKDMGGIAPLVFGHFGEISKGFDRLLVKAAKIGADRLKDALYVKTVHQAKAVLTWRLRRTMAGAIFRAQLDCLQCQMQHLTSSSNANRKRRAYARQRYFGDDVSRSSYHFRTSFSNFPQDSHW